MNWETKYTYSIRKIINHAISSHEYICFLNVKHILSYNGMCVLPCETECGMQIEINAEEMMSIST